MNSKRTWCEPAVNRSVAYGLDPLESEEVVAVDRDPVVEVQRPTAEGAPWAAITPCPPSSGTTMSAVRYPANVAKVQWLPSGSSTVKSRDG